MMRPLIVPERLIAQMRAHVAAEAPLEACGLLFGEMPRVAGIIEITNAEHSRVRFRMDPQEQFDAFMRIESLGQTLLGIYHSHPAGPAQLSATDLAEAAYDVVHWLWFRVEGIWRLRLFRLNGEQPQHVDWVAVQE